MSELIDPELLSYLELMAAAITFALLFELLKYLRVRFLKWRLQRRLWCGPELLPHEQAEYEYEIARFDPDEDAISLSDKLLHILYHLIAACACFAIGRRLGLSFEYALFFGMGAFAVIGWAWGRLNMEPSRDAPDLPGAAREGEIEIPTEAITGFAAAGLTIGIFVLFAWVL